MTSEDEKLRHRFSGERGMLVSLSCTAFNCKCKFSTVREEQHGKFHAFLLLKQVSKIRTKPTHRLLVTAPKILLVPRKTSSWQLLTPCSWEKPHWFLSVLEQGKNQPNPPQTRRQRKGGGTHRFRKPVCGSETRQPQQQRGVTPARQERELINDSALKTEWSLRSDSHTPDTLFHHRFAPPQPSSTLWVLKRNKRSIRLHVFPVCGKNTRSGVTDEMFLSKFKIPASISPSNSGPRVEHLNNQG